MAGVIFVKRGVAMEKLKTFSTNAFWYYEFLCRWVAVCVFGVVVYAFFYFLAREVVGYSIQSPVLYGIPVLVALVFTAFSQIVVALIYLLLRNLPGFLFVFLPLSVWEFFREILDDKKEILVNCFNFLFSKDPDIVIGD